ncbi:hypothetical protein [Hymenobacter sp. UYCo722]|uniref:hypothetical protein n=1 Tax=Hymenobacter sp. UYCo722 TaxID=3156335 RepID=UPI00339B12C0
MPRLSRPPAHLLALLLLAPGLLLPGCAPPNPTTAAGAAPAATPPPPAFPFGHRVDSLNGIAGHRFGEPLRAFPRLHLAPPDTGVPLQSYSSGAPTGWFSRHRARVPDQYYTFLDGHFFAFMAQGDPAVLQSEATRLFGPGRAQGPHQLLWEGRQARAVYSETVEGSTREGRLDVVSKPLEAVLAAKQYAGVKAGNAHQGAGK